MNTSKGSYADLERFAHVCSHDLKELLRIVANCMQLLCAHNADRFDDTSMAYVKHILSSLNRMGAMIHNILNYSKVSSIRDVCCDVDLNEVVNTIKNDFMFLLEDVENNGGLLRTWCRYMLARQITTSNSLTYVINSLRILMRYVTEKKEAYCTVFSVMSAIYRC
jgi:light-regulated signal transduction histidine kinase (bacteriophytochrome)